jgi:predicted ATP-grasp superfamily ATP-dependent carboligase
MNRVIVVGASARAAAFSARRAGLEPFCADLFADLDLAACASVTLLVGAEYPAQLQRVIQTGPAAPWMYTGALENQPELVGCLAECRPLWGNGRGVLRRVRDPFQLAACLGRAGVPHPQVRGDRAGLPTDGTWLAKPLAGAGGRGVRPWRGGAAGRAGTTESNTHYFQQRIDGVACAAVFVADGRQSVLIGVTRQLVGEPALHAEAFHYCGSIGPLALDHGLNQDVERLGQVLAAQFGLVGLFGVDGILADGCFWPVEINPRYTASVEVLELALGVPTMALHRDACTRGAVPQSDAIRDASSSDAGRVTIGKAILFAPEDLTVPDLSPWLSDAIACPGRWPVPRIADVPHAGERIAARRPICTVFAVQGSHAACYHALINAAQTLYEGMMREPKTNLQRIELNNE